MSKVIKFLPNNEMPLLYISDNKILALEDCINFFPSMFKLVKSIVVSEPLNDFADVAGDVNTKTKISIM
jgi:hypothetical protein